MALGADGNIWFSQFKSSSIGSVTPSGVITEYRVPSQPGRPVGLIAGRVRLSIWFCEHGSDKIGAIRLDV
jgi:virginiamycin B lyase